MVSAWAWSRIALLLEARVVQIGDAGLDGVLEPLEPEVIRFYSVHNAAQARNMHSVTPAISASCATNSRNPRLKQGRLRAWSDHQAKRE